jgi:hypothetical protein
VLDDSVLGFVVEDNATRRASMERPSLTAVYSSCHTLVRQILIEKHFAYRGVWDGSAF